jgi:hypothetical protein
MPERWRPAELENSRYMSKVYIHTYSIAGGRKDRRTDRMAAESRTREKTARMEVVRVIWH